ncbi:MAG TPA: hypothetical protein ENF22_04705 [Chloroflexi bacterium]|nr:hypothetical protein [Chloroflexota bacterium]
MDEQDKLRILIPHWIAHNNEHAQEFRDWAVLTELVSAEINAAADTIDLANKSLSSALEKLGGPLQYSHLD